MTQSDFIDFKARLLARKGELLEESDMGDQDRQAVELDQSSVGRLSRMDAMQRQAMAQETERRRLQEIQKIDAAIKRIESGDFGYCVRCDEEIAEKRLALDPAIAICISCARS